MRRMLKRRKAGQLVLKSVEKMKAGATVSNNDLITDIQSIFDAILMIPVENKKGEPLMPSRQPAMSLSSL